MSPLSRWLNWDVVNIVNGHSAQGVEGRRTLCIQDNELQNYIFKDPSDSHWQTYFLWHMHNQWMKMTVSDYVENTWNFFTLWDNPAHKHTLDMYFCSVSTVPSNILTISIISWKANLHSPVQFCTTPPQGEQNRFRCTKVKRSLTTLFPSSVFLNALHSSLFPWLSHHTVTDNSTGCP